MGAGRGPGAARERDVDSFDRRAGRHDHDWRAGFHGTVVTRSAELAAGVGVEPAAVLDIGCGTGSLLRMLAERLPFQDTSFDLVISTVSFDHWADQAAGLAEVARVPRPGGRLVLVDLFAIGWLRPIAALGRRRDRMRTAGELGAMLAAARLRPLARDRLDDLARRRLYDLARFPLVQALIAEPGRTEEAA